MKKKIVFIFKQGVKQGDGDSFLKQYQEEFDGGAIFVK